MKSLIRFALAMAFVIASLSSHAQTTIAPGTCPHATQPFSCTLLLDHQTPLGVFAEMQINDNLVTNAGTISFANMPTSDGIAYLTTGTLKDQTVTMGSQGPTAVSAQFAVMDTNGVEHSVSVRLSIGYQVIIVNRWTRRTVMVVSGTVPE
jgi:hypothetical protein